ncbi:hypothetical protein [Argonema galeatum]|uniref:hypothetical protein n=1 Tax=Argonema galeatum TaxID=2942762 RepID=UPI0020124FB7|nr:hypothetical protein [Argonema galeatum]MCL1466678.1 hypothetical protein [Argonema galeatum A003/A1]
MARKQWLARLSIVVLFGFTGGLYLVQEGIEPQIAQAYIQRINISLDRQPNESYDTIIRRAESVARSAVQRSFDSDILVTDAYIVVTGQNNGLMTPIMSITVSRSQWSNRPDIQRWARYYPNTRSLLDFDRVTTSNQPASANSSSQSTSICDSNQDPIGKQLCKLAELLIGKEKFQATVTGTVSAKPEEVAILGASCRAAVPILLKAPATAQFPEEPIVSEVVKGVYVVYGKVDSQNSFGALLRGNYTCIYRNTPQKGIDPVYIEVK